jgi:hypothetical protein
MSDPIERIIKVLKKVEQNSAFEAQESIVAQILLRVDAKFHDYTTSAELGHKTTSDYANRERLRLAGWDCDGERLLTTKGHIDLKWLASRNRKEIKKLMKSETEDFSNI